MDMRIKIRREISFLFFFARKINHKGFRSVDTAYKQVVKLIQVKIKKVVIKMKKEYNKPLLEIKEYETRKTIAALNVSESEMKWTNDGDTNGYKDFEW